MKVGIVGAGPIGLGSAALLANGGHSPVVWSPRGSRVDPRSDRMQVRTAGALTARLEVATMPSPAGLRDTDVVLFCVLGNGHKSVLEAIAPHLRQEQVVVIFSHASLGALYLSKLLAQRGIAPTLLALGTTLTGGPIVDGEVQVRFIRPELDVAAVPAAAAPDGIRVLRALFGDRFVPADDLMAITLSNLNPQIHLANCLLNFTRIENGERWDNYGAITESVGRLVEALDEERLALAAAFGVRVRTAREHYLKSFPGLQPGSVHEMAQAVDAQRAGSSPGPKSLRTRWLTEDLPFGLAAVVALGKVAGVPVPRHSAGLALLSAAVGHDFAADNDLLAAIGLQDMSLSQLQARAREGWPR
jgi:opine dehydrogenase